MQEEQTKADPPFGSAQGSSGITTRKAKARKSSKGNSIPKNSNLVNSNL